MRSTISTCHLKKFRSLVAIPQSTGTKPKEFKYEECPTQGGLYIVNEKGISPSESPEYAILEKIAFPFTTPDMRSLYPNMMSVESNGKIWIKWLYDNEARELAGIKGMDEGYKLIRDMAWSNRRYQFRVSNFLEGIDRRNGSRIRYELVNPKKGYFSADVNFSWKERGDRPDVSKAKNEEQKRIIVERWHLSNAKPLNCWDSTIAVRMPDAAKYFRDYCDDPPNIEEAKKAKIKSVFSIAFHALRENYYRTDEGLTFMTVHDRAKDDEMKMPLETATRSGHPARSRCPGGAAIIYGDMVESNRDGDAVVPVM